MSLVETENYPLKIVLYFKFFSKKVVKK